MLDVAEGRVVTVTVLFTDLVGSTAQRTALGDDVADDLVVVHDRLLRDAVAAHRGSVVKSTGDGVMAVFDAASDAVAAAVAILHAAEMHNRESTTSEHLVVRLGLSAGDVQFMAHDCHGTPVVEAARLEAAAAPNSILVSESVRALVGTRGGHRFASAGMLNLKGLASPVLAHEVLSTSPDDDAAPVRSTRDTSGGYGPRAARAHVPLPIRLESRAAFVGRTDERGVLDDALTAADTERFRRVALVCGEPGIGKTSLAADFARAAHAQGALVLYGRSDEDLGIPYQPWVEAIEHLLRYAPDLVPTAEMSARGGELRRLLPTITPEAPLSAVRQSEPDADRYLLYGAVIDLLARASERNAVVLVLDDLHWADKPTLLLLRHVVGAEAPMRAVIVATYRDSDIGPEHVLSEALVSLYRQPGVERVVLAGLDADALGALLERRAGHDLGIEGLALRDALLRETDGNPFFVSETLRDLAESGRLRRGDDGRWTTMGDLSILGLPATVREVVEQRVARLGVDVQHVLRLGAVIGRDFEVDLLTRAGETDEDSVLDTLDRAMHAALVRPVPGSDESFTFTHALIGHTLYEQMTPARRRRAHRRVAECIMALYGDDPGERAGQLANHWLAADPEGAEALRFTIAAGERALADLAPQEAVRRFEVALELLGRRGDVDERQRCAVLVALGDAQRHAGDARSRTSLLEGALLARRLGDDRLLVRAALSNTRGWASSAGAVDHDRVSVLEAALEAVGPGPSTERARLLATLSVEVSYDQDWRRRLAITDEALAIARALGDYDTLSYVLARRHNAIQIPDQLDERLANTAENVRITERLANPISRFWAAHYRMLDVLMAGRIDEVDSHLATVENLADSYGLPVMRYEAAIQRAWRELLAGRLETAEHYARSGFEIGTESSQPDAVAVFAGQLFLVRFDQGRIDEIEELVAAAADQFPEIAGLRGLLALARCETGKYEQVRPKLLEVAADGFASIPYDQLWLVTMTQWAMVAHHLHEPDAAAAAAGLLGPWHAQVAFTGAHVFGSVALPVALCESVTKRFDLAEEHFDEALAAHERLRAPIWSARTRLGWARMLQSRSGPGDLERAHELARSAQTTARELGCASIERDASTLLVPADGRER
jgi:class 3 adenylate cyclase